MIPQSGDGGAEREAHLGAGVCQSAIRNRARWLRLRVLQPAIRHTAGGQVRNRPRGLRLGVLQSATRPADKSAIDPGGFAWGGPSIRHTAGGQVCNLQSEISNRNAGMGENNPPHGGDCPHPVEPQTIKTLYRSIGLWAEGQIRLLWRERHNTARG